jgi:hypothetical protein
MKKRLLSLLLTLCMVLSLMPTTALAVEIPSDYSDYIDGGDVTYSGLDLEKNTPTDNTYYTAGDGYILWESDSSTLTLQDITIDTTTSSAIALRLDNDISTKVVIEGTNNITSKSSGIYHSVEETSIEGSGTLNIESSNSDGIFQNNKDLTITGDVTVITSTTSSSREGINAQYSLMISGNANVTASGGWMDIYSNENITINTTGTVNAPEIQADYFIYTAGTMIGSWVWEGKDNIYENWVSSVYGNVELTEDKTITAQTQEDGLTIVTDAILTIPEDITLTIEDETEITNNGTIVNNGIINLPEGTTAEEITALNLTGSGSIQVNGINVAVVDGVLYPYLSLSTTSTLDLSSDTTTSAALYVAGDGYIFWEPTLDDDGAITTGGTLTLKDATIENDMDEPLITLPTGDVIIVLEGNNTLTNFGMEDDVVSLISQGNVEDISYVETEPEDYTLTFDGDGSLDLYGSQTFGIFTDGTLVIEGGTFETFNVTEIAAVDFKMSDGYLYLDGGFMFLGDAEITGGELYTVGSEKGAGTCYGDFSITGGIVECGASVMLGGLRMLSGTFTHTGGTFNAIVTTIDYDAMSYISTTYGDAALEDLEGNPMYIWVGSMGFIFNIPSNSSLTIPSGAEVYMMGVTADNIGDYFSNEGTLINNGNFILDSGITAEEVKTIAQVINASGTGTLEVNDETPTYYTNSGEVMNVYEGDLDLSNQTEDTSGDGYTWTGNSTDGYTLTLDNIIVSDGDVVLPTNCAVTIVADSSSTISGNIYFSGDYACDLTITSSSAIIVNGYIQGNGMNGDMITVEDGAQVTVNGSISLGGSGGEDGTLLVTGGETTLSISSDDSGISCDTVTVTTGAALYVSADSYSIMAGKGGVWVTNGSTLSVGCEYGVYIIDGKLTVDSTSTLVTNATVAPFCVVDTTSTKEESDVVSLPGIPSGTEITSVIGEDEYYGYTYWSLVNTGDTLGVTDENCEPVTLTGAVTGTVTFAAATTDDDDSDSDDESTDDNDDDDSDSDDESTDDGDDDSSSSSSSGSSNKTYYIITATAGEGGSINYSGKVCVVSDGSKTFTITANDGYTVKDVLVDGVSVGVVDTYTFDEVSKIHTISASFEEVLDDSYEDDSYNDVKDSDWFKAAVDYVTEEGLMQEIGDGEFGPYISTDRGMIITILWRLEGQPSASANVDFTDVAQGQYYTDAASWGAENEIIKGYGNGEFGPEDTITREQMAAILYRYSNFKNYDTTQGGMAVREFSDYSQISDWALQSVTWAVNTGLISGKDNGMLDTRGDATRAQVAMILMRYDEDVAQ